MRSIAEMDGTEMLIFIGLGYALLVIAVLLLTPHAKGK